MGRAADARRIAGAARVAAAALTAVAVAAAPGAAAAGADETPELNCVVAPSETLDLSTAEPGLIARVHVSRGDPVEAGQLVAELVSDAEATAVALARGRAADGTAIASAEGRVAMLEARLTRNERLGRSRVVSEATLEEVRTELLLARQELEAARIERESAALELRRAEEMLARRRILAPVSGVVTERRLGRGEHFEPSDHVVSIAVLDPLHVETFAPVALHGWVRAGDRAVVTPEAPIGGAHAATVAVVDRVLDAASGTFGVRLDLPNPDFAIPAGVNCTLRLLDAESNRP